jgi:hypothetical protein
MRYIFNETNHCPGCGRSQWLIGRSTAECAFCSTAVLLTEHGPQQAPRRTSSGNGGGVVRRHMIGALA